MSSYCAEALCFSCGLPGKSGDLRKRNIGKERCTCETASECSAETRNFTSLSTSDVTPEFDRTGELVHHDSLPPWLQDNGYLASHHRPPLNSVQACLKSVFKIHSETGNIWTHLLGCVSFIVIACRYMTFDVDWQEKLVFSAFFMGAILCMGFSWLFHMLMCHSADVKCVFNKLDYCGVALLNSGSFIPWLYYTFYWHVTLMKIYLCIVISLAVITAIVSTNNTFQTAKYRSLRAGVFVALGLAAVVPAMHYVSLEGWHTAINVTALDSLIIMAVVYIGGAFIYAMRVPERWWPGHFDLWCNSHQIMHVCVIIGACIHYHGLSRMAANRLQQHRDEKLD